MLCKLGFWLRGGSGALLAGGRVEAEDILPMLAISMDEFNQSLKQWTTTLQTQVADVNKAGTWQVHNLKGRLRRAGL